MPCGGRRDEQGCADNALIPELHNGAYNSVEICLSNATKFL